MAFENVNFGLLKPTVQIENPMDVAMKGLAMKGQMQQQQMGGIQLQQAQQDQQDQATMRQLAQQGEFQTPDALADAAMKAGVSPKTALAMKMQGAEYQSKVASTAQALATAAQRGGAAVKEKMDMIAKGAEEGKNLAFTAKTPEDWQKGLAQIDAKYGPAGVPSLSEKYGDFTPQNVNMLALNGATMADSHAAAFGDTKSGPAGIVNIKTPLTPGQAPDVTQLVKGAPEKGIGPDGKPGFFQLGPNGEMPAGWKPMPTAAMINLNTGQAHNAGTGVDVTQPLKNPQAEGMARDFADGKPQPQVTSRTPAWVSDAIARGRQIYAAANGGDEQGYGTTSGVIKKARETWAPGGAMMGTAAAVDVATGHLAARDQYIEALKNNDTAGLNKLANYFKTQFGLSAAPNNLATINTLMAPEIAKVVKGSTNTNQSEIDDIRKTLGDSLSEEIQKSGGQVFRGAMGTRLENMEKQYQVAYPGKSLSRVLLPATVKTFPSVFGTGAQGGAGASPQRITATQADGTKLQLSADGKSWEPMGVK